MEGNLMEQLKAAANQPDVSMEEYKATRDAEIRNPTPVEETPVSDNKPTRHQEASVKEESEVGAEVEEKPYKPWETKEESEVADEEDEDVIVTDTDKKVPLQKLLKIKAQKKAKEAEIESYKAKLAEYEMAIKKTLPKEEAEVITDPFEHKIKSLKEPDPNQFDSWEEYKNAQDNYRNQIKEIEEERIVSRVERSYKERLEAEQRAREAAAKTQSFVDRIETAAKTNPEIKSAIGWFEQNMIKHGGVNSVDAIVCSALVDDDNAPELIYKVVQNKDLVEAIFNKSNPSHILKQIGKISAFIELEKDDSDSSNTEPVRPRKVVPKTVSGTNAGSTKTSDKADSLSEYKKLRAKEEAERRRR